MNEAATDQPPQKGYRRFAYPFLWTLIFLFFYFTRENLAPFIGALLLAYLLAPLVRRLQRIEYQGRSLPRWSVVLIIYVVLVLLIATYSIVAVPKVGAEFGRLAAEGNRFFQTLTPEKIDEYTVKLRDWIQEQGLPVRLVTPRFPDSYDDSQPGFVLRVDDTIRNTVSQLSATLRTNFFDFLKLGPKFAAKLMRQLLMMFLILMVAAFLLSDPARIIGFWRSLFPVTMHQGFEEVVHEIDHGLAGVVRGQVLIALLNGSLTFIGCLVLGVKFPVLLSSLTAILSLIPIFGSFLSAIPIVAVGLTDSFATGLGIMLWLIGINLAEANYFNPKIIGIQAKIHPALVVFVLLAGERLYGVVGALFAVPLTSIALAFFKVLHQKVIAWNSDTSQIAPQDKGVSV